MFLIADLRNVHRQQQGAGSPPAHEVPGFRKNQPSSQRGTYSISEAQTPYKQQNSVEGHSGSSGWRWMCHKPSAGERRAENHILRGISMASLRLYSGPQSTLAPEDRLHAVLQNPEKPGQLFGTPTWIQDKKNKFPGHRMHLLHMLSIMFPFFPFPIQAVHKPFWGITQNPSPFPAFPRRVNGKTKRSVASDFSLHLKAVLQDGGGGYVCITTASQSSSWQRRHKKKHSALTQFWKFALSTIFRSASQQTLPVHKPT